MYLFFVQLMAMKIDCGWDVKFNHNKCNWSHRHILFCGKIITRKRAQQSNKLCTKSLTTENNTAVHKIAFLDSGFMFSYKYALHS